MTTHRANVAYRIGLAGAAFSMLYTIEIVWLHETGRSLLLTPNRYVSREEMLSTIGIGIALALVSWGAGATVRYFSTKGADERSSKLRRHSTEQRTLAEPSGQQRR